MTADQSLVERLSAFRASGMDPAAAAAALMAQAAVPASSSDGRVAQDPNGGGGAETAAADSSASIEAADLSEALADVFGDGLTPAELASIIHAQYPDLPALGVAQAVQAGLPSTSQADMYNALTGCGFAASDAQGAVNILYPATVTVQSNQTWQSTGVNVTGQQVTTLTFASGSWTANPENGMCGPDGDPDFTAKSGYTLPGAAEGAMIGQVGSNPPFLVGSSQTAPSGQSGMLSLCINDDLNGIYGLGLVDNQGTMTFTITTTAAS